MTTKTYRQRQTATSLADRLAARAEPDLNSGCLLWAGAVDRGGYGQVRVCGSTMRAHRLAWLVANGLVPAHLHVLHRCDTPACINAAHMFLGTNADNAKDRATKGRSADRKGAANGRAKLTDAAVQNILARLAAGETGAALARAFGTSQMTISGIKTGSRWTHVTRR